MVVYNKPYIIINKFLLSHFFSSKFFCFADLSSYFSKQTGFLPSFLLLLLMTLFFLLTCLTSFFIYRFPILHPAKPWPTSRRQCFSFSDFVLKILCSTVSVKHSPKNSMQKKILSSLSEDEGRTETMAFLDLPEPMLDTIFERLPPDALCRMGSVSTTLRDKCSSDHFWGRHMKKKWGRILGPAAYQELRWHLASRKELKLLVRKRSLLEYIFQMLHISWFDSKSYCCVKPSNPLPADSILSWYFALESGEVWFPVQVYNRQNGHDGFLLSSYDAKVCYDRRTDTFQARYPAYGLLEIPVEQRVTWDRLRAPSVDTPPHDLHNSYCLNELHPGDYIEIQWRKGKEFPYGWWFGVVGHSESCDRNELNCLCSDIDIVVLEFNQHPPDSRWRHTLINRRDHRETGNEEDGFYGGIRKLDCKEEICTWKRLRPAHIML